jgi:hypothetical protein
VINTGKLGTVFLDELPGIGDQRDESEVSEIGKTVNKNGRLTGRNDRRGIEVHRHRFSVT